MFPPISRILETRPLLCLALLALLAHAPARGAPEVILETEEAEPAAPVAATAQPPAKQRPSKKPPVKGAQPARAPETGPAPARSPVAGVERVQFQRRPVTVVLEIGRERLVHFPFEVALHQPEQADGRLAIDNIGSTVYLTANAPMERVRLVAEGIDGQGMIPLDVLVRANAPGVPDEMEIRVGASAPAERGKPAGEADEGAAAPDLVDLSRHCVQALYAPQRLVRTPAGMRQVDVRSTPVANLYSGGALTTTPIGAWRADALHVTAVRFTNRGSQPVELDMDRLRGQWIAATPVHWRLLPQGDEADTTAVCLISEQPFEAVRP